jgi:hypothetical protein
MENMKEILKKYEEWVGEEDNNWEYDMVNEFFDAVLRRGELLDIISFLKEKTKD